MKNKITTKAFFVFITLFALSISNINISHAQVGDPDSNNSSCVTLDNNMRYRMRDTQVNNEVSDLQDYLIAEGYLSGSITGYFGVATLKAVKSFQSNNGLLASGYVGPITRAKIKSLSCDMADTDIDIPTTPVVAAPPVVVTPPKYCPNAVFPYFKYNSNTNSCSRYFADSGTNGCYTYILNSGEYRSEADCKSAKLATSTVSMISSFSSSQDGGDMELTANFIYRISGFRDGMVLDVTPTIACATQKDCSQYLFNLSGKAAEVYTGAQGDPYAKGGTAYGMVLDVTPTITFNLSGKAAKVYTGVQGDPYVKGGASYRFTGADGELSLFSHINPSYTKVPSYKRPLVDSVTYMFILRDIKNGGAILWSDTKTVDLKG